MIEKRKLDLKAHILELIKKTSTQLPPDVVGALKKCADQEEDVAAKSVFQSIFENVELAEKETLPICQDTGTPLFYIYHPFGYSTIDMKKEIEKAVVQATEKSYLRPNAVDPISGKNSGNNLGAGLPSLQFLEWDKDYFKISLILKGGGCENVGAQYKLPDSKLKAGRDLKGVAKVILDAIHQAQGKGCAPGVLGVGIGGDRVSSFKLSKEQLLRKLDDKNPEPRLQALEEEIMEKGNKLGIGPMGFGGKTTIFGVKIGTYHRLPASYFVSVSYMCWAYRRKSITINKGEVTFD